jgi:hydroxymethylglutaryl-CoA reductase (NADPH)
LAPATVIARRSTHAHLTRQSTTPLVNISSAAVSTVLSRIGEEIPTGECVVKVHSPVHIRVADSTLDRWSTSEEDDDEVLDGVENANRLESFMSFWTTIVSDPIMSKWIVLTLAASVFLNGYLLKGLGSSTLQRQQTPQSVTVLLEQAPTKVSDHESSSSTTYDQKHTNCIVSPHPAEDRFDPTPLPSLPVLPAPDAEAGSPVIPEPVERRSDLEPCRSLEECSMVFNGGPNGVQQLNDEEVILLAQQGKIAAYALEKVLGDLERAVLIRRALICKPSSANAERGTDVWIYSRSR